MNTKTFISRPEHYQRNYEDGEGLRVVPAKLNRDRDPAEAGVAIFINHKVTLVLTTECAYNLANGIADTLETHPNRVTTKQEN